MLEVSLFKQPPHLVRILMSSSEEAISQEGLTKVKVAEATKSARETISHCLVEYSFARSCWDRTSIGVDTTVTGSFADWLDDKFKLFEGDNRKILVITCWAIWKVRNELVWKKKGSSVAAVGILAHNFLSQWSQAQDKNDVPTAAFLSTRDDSEKWIKPVGDVKINVDAALFTETGRFSFACVARDAKGVFLEAISCCRTGCVTPEMAEAMGVRGFELGEKETMAYCSYGSSKYS
ncbi:hypothetical protein POM88_028322 [Heracleum sosnowskyi]|uniref:RNase H type-1 domain-containing protein n=1 Tax=Heracleum sosnowskyi TaxID=360622 RepID=A0AAD8IAE1_9APIA|nr:hypothetical protein POM88_028322 [Heracleum sosnowskyi]